MKTTLLLVDIKYIIGNLYPDTHISQNKCKD